MIRLIATDVDGTLVKESSSTVYPEIYEEIVRLTDKGIRFCVASGRQFDSVKKLFAPVEDRLSFIANNGAHIRIDNRDICVQAMEASMVKEILADIEAYGGLYVALVTPEGSFTDVTDQSFLDLLYKSYKNDGSYVPDLGPYVENTLKISVFSRDRALIAGTEYFIPKWKDRCTCCMAGDIWIDFVKSGVDKGNALRTLMEHLQVTPEETMVFGDNGNDLGMIRAAVHSYAVETAIDSVKEAAAHICPGYADKGVYQILRRL